MKLRFLVALVAACTLSAGACSKKADKPAEPTAGETAKADEAKADEAKADEAKTDEAKADEAKADEAKADEAKTDEAKAEPAADAAGDPMKRALGLQRKALEILQANKTDAKAAAAALNAFQKENSAEIEALKKDLKAMEAKLKEDPSAAMAMLQKYTDELQAMQKLTMQLMKEAPDLLSSPEVAAAMAKFSPKPDEGDEADEGAEDMGGDDAVTDEGDKDAVPTAKLSDEDKALLEDALVAQEKMIEILDANASEPDKAGDELSKYFEANKEKLLKLVDVQKRLASDQSAAMEFAQKNMSRITAIATKLSEIVKKNPGLLANEKVAAAMAKLNGAQ